MKLLPKSEITRAKALDTQREIEQGKQLATRVDKLRQVNAEEEAKLAKFREATLKKLKEDVNPLIELKDALTAEVKELEQRKIEAKKPLDSGVERIKVAKADLALERVALGEKSLILTQREEQVQRSEQTLEVEKGRVADLKRTASENLVQTDSTLKHAQETAADIRNKAQATLVMAELKIQLAISKEAELAVKEREIGIQRAYVDKRNADLDIERVTLREERRDLQLGFDELKRLRLKIK